MMDLFLHTAIESGKAIMEIYQNNDFTIETKSDNSPLTTADLRSNAIINENLRDLGLPILSEENKAIPYEERKDWSEFILVDPLDGTKEFIKRNGEFTVNIAVIRGRYPVMGVIYAPVPDVLYWGSEKEGAWKLEKASERIKVKGERRKAKGVHRPAEAVKLTVKENHANTISMVASKSHFSKETEEFIDTLKSDGKTVELVSRGSSLKLCLVAEGKADIYPRLGPTMEWDTAAGHAIARFAGCSVEKYDTHEEVEYNKESLLNPWFVVKKKRNADDADWADKRG